MEGANQFIEIIHTDVCCPIMLPKFWENLCFYLVDNRWIMGIKMNESG